MDLLAEHLARFDYTAIPLHRGPTGHWQLEAALNGAPARLYLDTGAGRTVLDLTQARARGLPLTANPEQAGGLGTASMATYRTSVKRLDLHTLTETDFTAAVVDLSHVNQGLRARAAEPMDGVLGADILEAREAVIDCKHRRLYLKRAIQDRAA